MDKRNEELQAMIEMQQKKIEELEFRNTALAIENRAMDDKIRSAHKTIYDSIYKLENARFETSSRLLISPDTATTLTNLCDTLMVVERDLMSWE